MAEEPSTATLSATQRRLARDTDRRFHTARADLEALMSETQAATTRSAGATILAAMVDVPLAVPRAYGDVPGDLGDVLPGASKAAQRRTGTAQVPRTVEPLRVAPRCHTAATLPTAASLGLENAESIPFQPVVGGVSGLRRSRESLPSLRAMAMDPSGAAPTDSSSPWSSTARSMQLQSDADSRPTSSHIMSVQPVVSPAKLAERAELERQHETLSAALVERAKQRDERRRLREEAKLPPPPPTDVEAPTQESQNNPSATPTSAEDTRASPQIAVQPASAPPAPPSPPPPPKSVDPAAVYQMEADLIKTRSALAREQRLAEELAQRQQRDAEAQRRRYVAELTRDVVWDEQIARQDADRDAATAWGRLQSAFAEFTPAMLDVCVAAREGAETLTREATATFLHLQRVELFARWVEDTAVLRVAEMEVREGMENAFFEQLVAMEVAAIEADARARVVAAWFDDLRPIIGDFSGAALKSLDRQLWLVVNSEADARFAVEEDERDAFFTARGGANASRALVKQFAADVAATRKEWDEHFKRLRGEIVELELAGRLLVQRDAADGFDRYGSDERFERADLERREAQARRDAVDAAIREAQRFAMEQQQQPVAPAPTPAAKVKAPVGSRGSKAAPAQTPAAKPLPKKR
jgi:hypothetical protein